MTAPSKIAAALQSANRATMATFKVGQNVGIRGITVVTNASEMQFGTIEGFALNSTDEIIVGVRVPKKLPTSYNWQSPVTAYGDLQFYHPVHLVKLD